MSSYSLCSPPYLLLLEAGIGCIGEHYTHYVHTICTLYTLLLSLQTGNDGCYKRRHQLLAIGELVLEAWRMCQLIAVL